MRLALLLPVLLSVAAPAYADGARESRYGPTTPRQVTSASVQYNGPMLGWSGKANVAPLAAPAAQAAAAPFPGGGGYQPARFPAPPAVPSAPAQAPLPVSLYAAPQARAPQAAASTAFQAPAPYAAPQPAPSQVPAQQVASLGPTTGGHFYSVARESGLTPDRIPPPGPDHRVLIASDVPAPPPEDATPVHGSADWLAAGVDGDDDDHASDSNRAKTRNQDQ